MSLKSSLLPKLTALALVTGLAAGAVAQNLDMQGTNAAFESGGPRAGMTQASVEANFGTPASKRVPVGDPPITRWDYAEFIVYFEYDKVIHSVRRR